MSRPTLVVALAAGLLCAPALALYGFAPQLTTWLVARYAGDHGLTLVSLEVERPGMNGLRISSLALRGSGIELAAEDVRIAYTWTSLRQGRLSQVVAAQLMVELPADRQVSSAPAAAGGVEAIVRATDIAVPRASELFDRLPVSAARIETLELAAPAFEFQGRGALVLDAGSLKLRLAALAPERARAMTLDAAFTEAGNIAIELSDPDGKSFFHVRSSLPDQTLEIATDLLLDGYLLEVAAAGLGLPAGAGSVSAALNVALPWPLPPDLSWQQVKASGPVEIDWRSADGMVAAHSVGGRLSLLDGVLSAELTGRLTAKTEGFDLRYQPATASISIAPFLFDTEGELTVSSTQGSTDGRLSVNLQTADGDARSFAFHYEGFAVLPVVDAGRRLPLQLDGNGTRYPARLSAGFRVTSPPLKNVPVDLTYEFAERKLTLNASQTMGLTQPLLDLVWPAGRDLVEVEGGQLDLQLEIAGSPSKEFSGTSVVVLSNAAARTETLAIRGLEGTVDLAFSPGGWVATAAPLRAELLDVGVPLTEAVLSVSRSTDRLEFGAGQARLLGGRVSVAPFNYRIDDRSADLSVQLDEVDLSEVLALEGEHVTGSGRLSGQLPVIITEKGVRIEGGRLSALAPGGSIRVNPSLTGSLGKTGVDLAGIAINALTNYQYSRLEADINYSEAGDLALGVRLEGRNPDVEKGRAIHYNLNVTENIPVLLESLRLQDEFIRRIEKEVRE